jgi:ParB family chromosome partitioning protein
MQYKEILINDITPDINQPRKFFDETAMQELTASVLEKGIIQPIMVRLQPNGISSTYMLVCGERRLRAATEVFEIDHKRNTIPAVIAELTDDEALEMQIIENLQRKDVHPLEEAVAFDSMLQHGMDVKTIADKVGKSDYFIRQRIKLCNLTEDWQKAFFANRLSITDALKITLYSATIQDEILDKQAEDKNIKIELYDLKKYSGHLKNAIFKLDDAELLPSVGSCINCQYNSATAMLFPDAAENPVCSNLSCFTNKCDLQFTKSFDLALQDPAMIFVEEAYRGDDNRDIKNKISSAGFTIYKSSDVFEYKHALPDKPDFEDDWLNDHDDDANGCIEAFDNEMQEYLKDITDVEKEKESGKYKPAFYINGNNRGEIQYVNLYKNNHHKKTDFTDSGDGDGDVATSNLKDEIERLTSKEKRSKELDEQKIWELVKKQFNPAANASLLKGEFTMVENQAAAFALYNKLNYHMEDPFCELFKLDKRSLDFSKVTDEQLRQMIRFFFLDTLPPVALYSGYNEEALVSLNIARYYFPSVLQEIENDQAEISTRRIAKVNDKIAELKKQLEELEPAKPKAADKKSKKVNMKNVDC